MAAVLLFALYNDAKTSDLKNVSKSNTGAGSIVMLEEVRQEGNSTLNNNQQLIGLVGVEESMSASGNQRETNNKDKTGDVAEQRKFATYAECVRGVK